MPKELRCRDLGFDCDAVVRVDDEDQLLDQVVEHLRHVHRVSSRVLSDPAFARIVRDRIHDQAEGQ